MAPHPCPCSLESPSEQRALGVRAVENGFSVLVMRLDDLLAAMKRDADAGPSRLHRKKDMNVALLVIDEVGFDPMSRQEESWFFRLVSHRYGRSSILITTNKGIRDSPEVLAMATSIGCCTAGTCSTSRAGSTGCGISSRPPRRAGASRASRERDKARGVGPTAHPSG